LIYQSYNWSDVPTYRYDSQVKNPKVSPKTFSDGAASGVVELEVGDKLHFNCHIVYTDKRADEVRGPLPSVMGPLRFANEAYKAEMCIQYATMVPSLPLPVADSMPPPDFARNAP
jgi:hypothetical protein